MEINRITRPRKIDYYEDIISDDLSNKVFDGSNYEAFKLQIKQRHIQTVLGELNFIIRDKSNNLKYILVYNYMMEPEKIFKTEYYVNDTLKLPSREVVNVEPMLDDEIADLYVKDLIVNYIEKNYEIV